MSADMSFFHLITGASLVVQLVMLLLLVVSMVSWTMIFRRRAVLKEAQLAADEFEDRFWSGGDLAVLFRDVSAQSESAIGMAGIFQSGFNEFARLRSVRGDAVGAVELLALVIDHPDSLSVRMVEGPIRDSAAALLAELEPGMDPAEFRAALARGRTLNLEETALALARPE